MTSKVQEWEPKVFDGLPLPNLVGAAAPANYMVHE
jgi:hypothetical protein